MHAFYWSHGNTSEIVDVRITISDIVLNVGIYVLTFRKFVFLLLFFHQVVPVEIQGGQYKDTDTSFPGTVNFTEQNKRQVLTISYKVF